MSKSLKSSLLCTVLLLGLAVGPADASLIGASVTGSLIADGGSGALSADLVNPANGHVPLSYLNSGTPIIISNSEIEFGLDDIMSTK